MCYEFSVHKTRIFMCARKLLSLSSIVSLLRQNYDPMQICHMSARSFKQAKAMSVFILFYLTLTFHFVMRASCYSLLILRGYTLLWFVQPQTKKFEGLFKDLPRTNYGFQGLVFLINRHSLTAPFWTSYWQNHVMESCIIITSSATVDRITPNILLPATTLMKNDWVWLAIASEVQRQPLSKKPKWHIAHWIKMILDKAVNLKEFWWPNKHIK